MKRYIDTFLVHWKNKKTRKPLVIRGARQVGKTFSVGYFGNQQFDNFVKVDFELERSVHKIFDGDLKADKILLQLEAAYEQRIVPGKTLLFFDEIQECSRAVISLRYFYEQMPELHLIAAGSLLELALGDFSFPVGRVEFQWLRPLGFDEFLWATGYSELAHHLPTVEVEDALPDFIHDKLMEQLRYYFLVGGMPEAVSVFADTSSLTEVNSVQKNLSQSYLQDFTKYGQKIDRDCIEHIFQYMPGHVGQRIKYTALYPEKRIEKIKQSLHLLELMLLVQKVSSTTGQGLPLGADIKSKVFKSIFLDIGLMQSMSGISATILLAEKDLLAVYRGALAEQFVGQELLLHGGSENDRLYYWDRPKKSSNAEVDFLIARNGKIIPVEVKSGVPARLKSMALFLQEHPHCDMGYVLYSGNIRSEPKFKLKYMPLYTNI